MSKEEIVEMVESYEFLSDYQRSYLDDELAGWELGEEILQALQDCHDTGYECYRERAIELTRSL